MLRNQAAGRTALFDAIVQTAREIAAQHGKKAIVVFTDGNDNSSMLTGSAAVARARKGGIPVYAVAEGEALGNARLMKDLETITDATGGGVYKARNGGDIAKVFESISYDLRHTYLLSFTPPPAPADTPWRRVEVRVRGLEAGYGVRARKGYVP